MRCVWRSVCILGLFVGFLACGDDPQDPTGNHQNHRTNNTTNNTTAETHYAFDSRFESGKSGVSYTGQIARHILISRIKAAMGDLTARIDAGYVPEAGKVVEELNLYFVCDQGVCDGEDVGVDTTPAPKQSVVSGVSGGKNLIGKIAGNDATGQHKEWNADGFSGWTPGITTTPQGFVEFLFAKVEEQSIDRANASIGADPSGAPLTTVTVTPEGHDLAQLAQKFLLGAVAFSQGADDYLDNDIDGKGLLSANDVAAGDGKAYSALEHGWDEGFGYFGAARDYLDYTDDEIAGKGGRDDHKNGYYDSDGDGAVDLASEYNWGHSVNAGKRDRGHSTDLTGDAFSAFHSGRKFIAEAGGNLSDEQMTVLVGYRDDAIAAWEKAIAATCIHYINDVMSDMGQIGMPEYNFYDHAKHWSELKGFAFSFQFNPHSPMTESQFAELHGILGTAPVLEESAVSDHMTALERARTLLGQVYGFETADVESW
jgi:hypothetical protein